MYKRQTQPRSPAGPHPLLVAGFDLEAIPYPYPSPWPLPRNRVEIEVESQPERRESERPENDGFLPELAAGLDVEAVGWFQYGIRETLCLLYTSRCV